MFLYNLAIRCYTGLIRVAALFNQKARFWILGRKDWEKRLKEQLHAKNIQEPVWIHCASLGEFEQGRPLIEALKKTYPKHAILLTFYSPSGFEVRKNYEGADVIAYLPADTRSNAQRFINVVKPKAAIFVKYEFWLNFLFELNKQHIPTFLVSAVFKAHQPFFKWYGGIFRKALPCYHTIFTQDQASSELLSRLGRTSVVAGDTRFDRVLEISQHPKDIEEVRAFTAGKFTIIGGSTWAKDEELLLAAYADLKPKYPELTLVLAPHEIDQANIERLWNLIGSKGFNHCFVTDDPKPGTDVVIVNTMGYLSSIYRYGSVAVIGGGFNDGIHNVLEPAVYGLPVVFGPNYKKFNEAIDLLDLKGAYAFSSGNELLQTLKLFLDDNARYNTAAHAAGAYVKNKAGATQRIMQQLQNLF